MDSTYAWGQAISGMTLIPGLRGLWSGSSIDEHKGIVDLSSQGREIVAMNTLTQGRYGILPYIDFSIASSEYLKRVTEVGLEITTGLTLWTWVRFHPESTGQNTTLLSKWGLVGNYGYKLEKDNNDDIYFRTSVDGTNITFAPFFSWNYNYLPNVWYFIAGRFAPVFEIATFIGRATDGWFDYAKKFAVIPASIYNSTAAYQVGAADAVGAENYLDGDMSLFGIAAEHLTDTEVWNIFSQTRPLLV
jgi:hypothetical protein